MAWLVFAVSLPVQQFILDENLVIHPNASETRFSYILLVLSNFTGRSRQILGNINGILEKITIVKALKSIHILRMQDG